MPVLENLKQERYANGIAEGLTQLEAYKKAGFRGIHASSAASHLAASAKVKARIEELRGRISKRAIDSAVQRVAITKEIVIRELWDNAELAKSTGQASAVRNRALELIGKELGMFRDLEPIKPPRLEDLPSEDLERMLAQSIADNPPAEPESQAPPPPVTQ